MTNLKSRALAFLTRHGKVTDKQLARFIRMAPCTAWKYLDLLCAENLAHRTYGPLLDKGGRCVFFNIGPAPQVERFDSRTVVKAWVPMGIVDPWMLPREFFAPGVSA